MMALHGSNVPGDAWSLPRGYDYDWSELTFPRNPDLWKTAKTFLTEALDSSGTDVVEVNVPVRKVDEEVVHYNIRDATASQYAVLYKVFGKIHEWVECPYVHRQYYRYLHMRGPSAESCRKTREFLNMSRLQM
jgi:hypothetical protein